MPVEFFASEGAVHSANHPELWMAVIKLSVLSPPAASCRHCSPPRSPVLTCVHRSRLMQIWRSAGWPCKDGVEIDLLAAGLVAQHIAPEGFESLRLTDEGIRTLALAPSAGLGH